MKRLTEEEQQFVYCVQCGEVRIARRQAMMIIDNCLAANKPCEGCGCRFIKR